VYIQGKSFNLILSESNASFIVHGVMDYLVGDSEGAKFLRNNFVFKIVPMLNPDGVIVGNYRCSLSGLDLNRQWVNPSTKTAPENYSTKMVRSLFIIV